MNKNNVPLLAATIGFFATLLVFTAKEIMDRRRQWRIAVNSLSLLIVSLRQGLEAPPAEMPHVSLENFMGSVYDLTLDKKMTVAFLRYDEALRLYRRAWRSVNSPAGMDKDKILLLLSESEAKIVLFKEGFVGRALNWLAGIRE